MVGVVGFSASGAAADFRVTAAEVGGGAGGEEGRLAVGVVPLLPGIEFLTDDILDAAAFSFFVFFFLLTIASCCGSGCICFASSIAAGDASSLVFSSSSCRALARSCRSFFIWLFVFARTGAEPTFPPVTGPATEDEDGGGELARDCDVDVIDRLSDMDTCSLDGVPGTFMDATLGLRDGIFPVSATGKGGLIVVGNAEGGGGGVSALGVGTILNVRGAVLTSGEEDDAILGLSGFDVWVKLCCGN